MHNCGIRTCTIAHCGIHACTIPQYHYPQCILQSENEQTIAAREGVESLSEQTIDAKDAARSAVNARNEVEAGGNQFGGLFR